MVGLEMAISRDITDCVWTGFRRILAVTALTACGVLTVRSLPLLCRSLILSFTETLDGVVDKSFTDFQGFQSGEEP